MERVCWICIKNQENYKIINIEILIMTVIERISANANNANMKMGLGVFSNAMKPIYGGRALLNEGDILIFPPLAELGDRIGSQYFMGKDYEFLVVEVQDPDGTKRAMIGFQLHSKIQSLNGKWMRIVTCIIPEKFFIQKERLLLSS